MKARAREYRPKQNDYDIADGIKRSFVKTDSSKFIKFINGMGLFVGHHENMTHFAETETLPIFRFLWGLSPTIQDTASCKMFLLLSLFSKTWEGIDISGNSQTFGPSRASQTMLFVEIFPLPFPHAIVC